MDDSLLNPHFTPSTSRKYPFKCTRCQLKRRCFHSPLDFRFLVVIYHILVTFYTHSYRLISAPHIVKCFRTPGVFVSAMSHYTVVRRHDIGTTSLRLGRSGAAWVGSLGPLQLGSGSCYPQKPPPPPPPCRQQPPSQPPPPLPPPPPPTTTTFAAGRRSWRRNHKLLCRRVASLAYNLGHT